MHLTDVYLMGMYLIGVYVMGVCHGGVCHGHAPHGYASQGLRISDRTAFIIRSRALVAERSLKLLGKKRQRAAEQWIFSLGDYSL
jgi:hypothetical protein